MIDKFTVEKIKNAADIVEVVSDYVHLTRRGSNYMGLCPFHNERTPSFSVNRRRNFCYCFSCKKGGSPVNFIMEKEGISYHDALLQLAAKYGIKVEERELTDEEKRYQSERESMFVANDWAMKQMQRMMTDTDEGRDVGLQYFYQRGITEEAIREFRLGYALDRGNPLTTDARKAGFDIEVFRKLGLSGVSQQGREYDRFHGRVIFPILNSSGKAIGFGGRDLKGGPAKYINSPESEIYVKSNELYGIFQAKSEIVRQDKCFLVEGYMDVIGMWQSGMKNVIASSGTALTDGQIALIHRFTENVTLLYDGDAAGIKAALRGIDMLLSHRMKVKVLLLPDGQDPDEFAKAHTPEEFRDYVATHETDIIRFKAQVMLRDAADDPQRMSAAILSTVQSLAAIPSDIERSIYIKECAKIFNVAEEMIAAEVAKKRSETVEKLRQERQRRAGHEDLKNIGNNSPLVEVSTDTSSNVSSPDNQAVTPAVKDSKTIQAPRKYPLEPLERKIIENCLNYGFIDFCLADEENPSEGMINVAQYIREELEADGITLQVPVYARMFQQFDEYLDEYRRGLRNHLGELEADQRRRREEAYQEIAAQGLSMQEIDKREKKLEESFASEREFATVDFARFFSGDIFASHEDDGFRRVVNSLVNERYTLSKIFTKHLTPKPLDEDLEMLIPRCVIELKSEIIDQKGKELRRQIDEINVKLMDNFDDKAYEESMKLIQQLQVINAMGRTVGKNLGDRTLRPPRL